MRGVGGSTHENLNLNRERMMIEIKNTLHLTVTCKECKCELFAMFDSQKNTIYVETCDNCLFMAEQEILKSERETNDAKK